MRSERFRFAQKKRGSHRKGKCGDFPECPNCDVCPWETQGRKRVEIEKIEEPKMREIEIIEEEEIEDIKVEDEIDRFMEE